MSQIKIEKTGNLAFRTESFDKEESFSPRAEHSIACMTCGAIEKEEEGQSVLRFQFKMTMFALEHRHCKKRKNIRIGMSAYRSAGWRTEGKFAPIPFGK